MKSLLLFLTLTVAARATPYVFTLTGATDLYVAPGAPFALGETFTASFLVDTAAPDATAGDPVLGRYYHGAGASVHFSGGYSLTDLGFEYRVVDSGYSPVIDMTLDALIFDIQLGPGWLTFAYRFTPDTFLNDLAITPVITPLEPDPMGGLIPAEMLYFNPAVGTADGTITSITVAPANVPDTTSVLLLITLPLVALVSARRRLQA